MMRLKRKIRFAGDMFFAKTGASMAADRGP